MPATASTAEMTSRAPSYLPMAASTTAPTRTKAKDNAQNPCYTIPVDNVRPVGAKDQAETETVL